MGDDINEHTQLEYLKNKKCDKCDKPAEKWFGRTNIRICNSQDCYDKVQIDYDAYCEEDQYPNE